MKTSAVILAALLGGSVAQAANYESYNGFTSYSVPKLPEKEVHPSLWFNEADAPRLRALKDQDELAAGLWKQIEESPFLTMAFPAAPKADDDKKTIHQYYGSMSQAAKYSAFMAWMTEDPAKRRQYADRAIAALERAYDGPIKALDPRVKSGPVDEIYMGTWLQNYAAAYDWVQPMMTPEQDQKIRARLAEENERVAKNVYVWTDRPHNHLSKPAWGVGSMALALSDDERATSWLGIALAAANDNTRYFFSADGIYREGSHYMIFSWVNFLPFMWHYRNVSGVNQFKDYQPLMEWGVAARNGKGWLPNIEDAYIRPFPGHMAAAQYKEASTQLHSSAPLAEVMTWGFKTTDMGPFDKYVAATGYNYTGATWDYSLPLDEYLTYDPTIASTAPDCSPTVFLEGGQTMFRNSWTSSDPAHRYLLFQGVAEADNHQHADHLSYILFAENQMMAADAGYTRGSYRDTSRTSWYNKPFAHNVVTLDGDAPVDVAENVTPVSRYRIDTDFFDFEEKEAPYPNGGLLRRAIAFPGEQYFVVADIVTAPKSSEALSYLHGGRGVMTGEGPYRVWDIPQDEYGPAARFHTWTFGAESIEDDEGEGTYLKNDYGSFPYIKASQSGTEMVFLQILYPTPADDEGPKVESTRVGAAIWATVQRADESDAFMLQPTSAPTTFGGVETDATFLWLREHDGAVSEIGFRHATYVKVNNSLLFESLTPKTAAKRAVSLSAAATQDVPETLLMDGAMLAESKLRLERGDAALAPAYEALLEYAATALTSGVFSVMNKSAVPPSGDQHDYMSMGRYWWPDPSKPDGLPYIRRDGETNPESQGSRSDRYQMDDMVKGVEFLGLAYYFTGEQRYADQAAELLRVWFLDPATKMNPNLNFAQGIPGREDGRKSGLIDARILSRALDGLALISGSESLSTQEWAAIRAWFSEYLDWLKTNPLAMDESNTKNNHSTYFDVQIVHVALFVGDEAYARQVVGAAVDRRIKSQIRPDGSMPEELARTRPLHYTVFNTYAFFQLARLAEHLDVDLWHAADARLRAALDFVVPYADPGKEWPYPSINEMERVIMVPLLIQAARVYDEPSYLDAVELLPKQEKENSIYQVVPLSHMVVPLMR